MSHHQKVTNLHRVISAYRRQQKISATIQQNGYVRLRGWRLEESTLVIAESIGKIVDVSTVPPYWDIPVVQTLKPSRESDSSQNRYSGTFGLGEFPLHTDFAHWLYPPRYLMLRCIHTLSTTLTKLLPTTALESMLTIETFRNALVRPRHRSSDGTICLLPLTVSLDRVSGCRWDPLFLVPMNIYALKLSNAMRRHQWDHSKLVTLTLSEVGDTLLIDNWRMLHGRGSVSNNNLCRVLERIYLSEIFG